MVVSSSLEVGTAKETLDVICETVFERSTVVDEISDARVEIAPRDVSVGRVSSLERLALVVTLSKGTEEANDKDEDGSSTIDEVAKDSATDVAEMISVGKLVMVVSSSV